MQVIHALTISDEQVFPANGAVGHVLSVHDEHLNIAFPEGLVTFERRGCPMIPFGIEVDWTESWHNLNMSAGLPVYFTSAGFVFGDAIMYEAKEFRLADLALLEVGECNHFSCRLVAKSKLSVDELQARLQFIRQFCAESHAQSGIQAFIDSHGMNGSNTSPINVAERFSLSIHQGFIALVEGIQQSSMPKIADGVHGLLGAGPGLTPSGDDFLLGFLASLHCVLPDENKVSADGLAWQLIMDAPFFTTRLSAEYLKYAATGLYHQDLLEFIQSFCVDSEEIMAKHAQKILKMGHYSGNDMLLGFSYGGMTALRVRANERGQLKL